MSFHLKIIDSQKSEEMSHRSRTRIESPEEPMERISVFERLGKRIGLQNNRSTDLNTESDLRTKVSRKRRPNELSPNRRSVSPHSRQQTTGTKSLAKTEDKSMDSNSKVKSLVMPANTRPESPTSTSRRSGHSSHKWDDDIDSEALEQKRLELQKQLQELEKSGPVLSDERHKSVVNIQISDLKVTQNSSRSSSIISSESNSTLKSLTKTESSENSDKKVTKSPIIRDNKKSEKIFDIKKSEKSRTHVSSSISLKSVTHLEESTHRNKTSEVKLDRHGNVRISLDEMERQKRLRAERFGSTIEVPQKNSSNELKIMVSRDHSYSPPLKRSKDSTSGRHHNISDLLKVDRSDDKIYKHKRSSTHTKYETSTRSLSRERSHSSKRDDTRVSKAGSDRDSKNYLDSKSSAFRDTSRDSRYSDRDNTSVTSRNSRKRVDNYSRDESPAHSSHSKLSRDRESSIGSDFSRRSKSERMSNKSIDNLLTSSHSSHNPINSEVKTIEIKTNDNIIEEMSPISADSTIPDDDIDSHKSDTPITPIKIRKNKSEESLSPIKAVKTDDDSEDNFSDWSEGEDEILLKTDGFETMDEVCNISDSSLEKDPWIENKSSNKRRVESSSGLTATNKDDALEAISDDELDAIIGDSDPIDSTAESRNTSSNRQVLDALDIDWGSLVSDSKPKTEFISGSARKRFSAANVLMRIGFSQELAGPEMSHKLIDFCQKELKEEFVPFRHPMAAIHSFISDRIRERRQLFGANSSQSTVLSGRKDLQIRKMFNKTNFKLFDNCLVSRTAQTTEKASQPTTSLLVNDSLVSSTNPIETNASDIECF